MLLGTSRVLEPGRSGSSISRRTRRARPQMDNASIRNASFVTRTPRIPLVASPSYCVINNARLTNPKAKNAACPRLATITVGGRRLARIVSPAAARRSGDAVMGKVPAPSKRVLHPGPAVGETLRGCGRRARLARRSADSRSSLILRRLLVDDAPLQGATSQSFGFGRRLHLGHRRSLAFGNCGGDEPRWPPWVLLSEGVATDG